MKRIKLTAAVAIVLVASLATAQNAVTDWNAIAIIAGRASTAPGSATPGGESVYIAYMQLAVYNAVNAIYGGFEPYKYTLTAPVGASADAATVEAAYRTLLHLLPDQTTYLTNQYVLSLAAISNGPGKVSGQALGMASANALIALRVGDGLGANVPYTWPGSPVPGVWIPTPPSFSKPQTPWLGQMRPFTFDNPAKFLPDEAPPNLLSDTWTQDYNQTKTLGAVNSTVRTPNQTEIAMFWTDHTTTQFGRLLRGLAAQRHLSLADTARLFAMAYAAEADSIIGCYNAKYYFSFWRPVTAIQNGDIDGNPDTVADPTWMPLVATPAHPEYPSAHCCLTGALAEVLKDYFGSPNLQLAIDSTVTGTTHTFNNVNDWQNEVENARIYVGFHYHHSVVQGDLLGRKVAQFVTHNYFQPVN
ncbi:MAG TPA: vanadium-dependent haloperoxidase [Terriglobales bacterium]